MVSRDIEIRVGYKDTDAMGVVHHSNYIVYYEIARTEMLRQFGTTYKEIEAAGIMMPVMEVNTKYYSSAKYDDILTVRVSLKELPTATMKFDYEIYNQNGVKINTGYVILAFISAVTRRATRAPQLILDVLKDHLI